MVSRIAQSGVIWRQSSWRRGLPGDPGQKWCRSEPEWQEGEAEEDRGKGISWRGGAGPHLLWGWREGRQKAACH